VLVNDDVQKAFADLIDKHMIGTHPGGADTTATFTTSFDNALANCSQSVELGTSADGYALAISAAMEKVESAGYNPSGMVASFDSKRPLRDARDGFGRSLYRNDFQGDVEQLEGMNLSWSTNLSGAAAPGLVGGAGSPAKVVAIVGDFNAGSKPVIRNDMQTDTFREATVGSHNLAEQNKVAVRWEMRMGYQIFDRDRAFCKIINAA
jgi:HK97 family phage major capsid protein